MKRTHTHRLLLLAALLHLLADVAFAGEAVLCVGPNDHNAIEIGHLAPGCETLASARQSDDSAGLAGEASCAECTDSPLHSAAEMPSERVSWDPALPAALGFCFPVQAPLAVVFGRPLLERLDRSTTMRAQRSIVLIV